MWLLLELFSKAEVDEFGVESWGIDHDILGFDIAVHDALAMEVGNCWADLSHNALDLSFGEFAIGEALIKVVVLGEVHVEVFENEIVGVVCFDAV